MEQFVVRENLRRLTRLIDAERDPVERARLEALRKEEEARLQPAGDRGGDGVG